MSLTQHEIRRDERILHYLHRITESLETIAAALERMAPKSGT